MTNDVMRTALFRSGLLAALLLTPSLASAQLPIPLMSVNGGVSSYSLANSGTTPFGALRVDVPLLVLLAEGSLGIMRPDEQLSGGRRTYVIPEAQLQYQLLPMLVRPYVGAGLGWFKAVSGPGALTSQLTPSVAAGVRLSVPVIPLGFRGEVRYRGVGSGFSQHATEFTIGVNW